MTEIAKTRGVILILSANSKILECFRTRAFKNGTNFLPKIKV